MGHPAQIGSSASSAFFLVQPQVFRTIGTDWAALGAAGFIVAVLAVISASSAATGHQGSFHVDGFAGSGRCRF